VLILRAGLVALMAVFGTAGSILVAADLFAA
jgi:hypothetical protein